MPACRGNNTARFGFTLIELSIVLVVIGLVVASILVGESIKRSSQLQRMVTDETKYVEAAKQFKEKYGYPPGDFPNATGTWGVATGGCPGGESQTPAQATCNGNGNGQIEGNGVGEGAAASYETFAAWQQLANAGYIEGRYTGSPGPTCNNDNVPGLNEPATSVQGGGFEWNFYTSLATSWTSTLLNIRTYQQYLLIGAPNSLTTCNDDINPIMTPAEALGVDSKVDDGLPGLGKWTSNNTTPNASATPCSTTNTAATAVYNAAGTNNGTGSYKPTQQACMFAVEVDW